MGEALPHQVVPLLHHQTKVKISGESEECGRNFSGGVQTKDLPTVKDVKLSQQGRDEKRRRLSESFLCCILTASGGGAPAGGPGELTNEFNITEQIRDRLYSPLDDSKSCDRPQEVLPEDTRSRLRGILNVFRVSPSTERVRVAKRTNMDGVKETPQSNTAVFWVCVTGVKTEHEGSGKS